MPLNKQWKPDMAGTPQISGEISMTEQSSSDAGTQHPISTPETTFTPVQNRNPAASVPTTASIEMLFQSIMQQLTTLNQKVAELERDVLSSVPVDTGVTEKLCQLEAVMQAMSEKQDRNDRQLVQTLRENANFQVQVRQGMQHDIGVLKELQSGEQFTPLLKEIAAIYVEYQTILEDDTLCSVSRKTLKALFEQLEDLLVDYDAEICRSNVGDIRQTRSTKIIGKIPTGEQDRHNTVAASRKPGVVRGRTVLYPEFVDVYIFDPALAADEFVSEKHTSH